MTESYKLVLSFNSLPTPVEVKPRIFHVSQPNRFDTAMTFLRYQEFYEGVEPWFRKAWRISSYMLWYARERGDGDFTYATDWSGFNVPGWVLQKFFEKDTGFLDTVLKEDWTPYDNMMLYLIGEIRKIGNLAEDDWNFYLIGTTSTSTTVSQALNHEIAHGLYYTNPEYKNEMDILVENLVQEEREELTESLLEMGYHNSVITDEIQAYCSTDLDSLTKEYKLPFYNVFAKYTQG